MQYISEYQQLKNIFDLNCKAVEIPGTDLIIKNFDFVSKATFSQLTKGKDICDDFSENIRFRYPVITHSGKEQTDKAIILLHGLNERTWHKHLTGAAYLARNTGKAVILFPLSFHINRGLPDWTDTRKMSQTLEQRKFKYKSLRDATVVNCALSERLTEQPGRFFISGIQSSMDLISLMKQIKNNEHPLFLNNTSIDLFAYSIGCTLLQTLMIYDPESILANSRMVLFAGGSLFGHIQAVSRFIMDSVAFETIQKFYLNTFKQKKDPIDEQNPLLMEHPYGKAFRSILTPSGFRKERERAMDNFMDRLLVIALKKDKVMPVEGIKIAAGEKFLKTGRFRILDFQYDYTHENPFPVLYKKIDDLVERAFYSVFDPAASFLGSKD